MRKHFILLGSCLIVGLAGCSKSETQKANTAAPSPANQPESNVAKIDACTLLTSKEIESVQGDPLKETKPSRMSGRGVALSQCFFTLPTFANSISLTVTQRGDGSGARDPKQFWDETFHREKDSEKARNNDKEKGREEEGKAAAPEKIEGIGDEAFWLANRVGGALYVLKGNTSIRVSVGGSDDQATKIKKSKALAEMVLKRL
jgi:hypothetical protein